MLTAQQLRFFAQNGYLVLRDFLSAEEARNLQRWAQEVHDWTPAEQSDFMPYEVLLPPRRAHS